MQDQHIVASFDRDLEAIQAMIMKMGGLTEAAIADSAKALELKDADLAQQVRQSDKAIDRLEEQVNEEAARLIALRQPMGTDLRTILTVMKISGNLERVGDYAKNLAKRTALLVQMSEIDGAYGAIRRMGREIEVMLADVLDAYVQHDADKAEIVRQRDHEVDQMYNALFREFLTFMMEDPRNITACMHLHFIAKNIERMGDHVTSIAEQVIYMVTGEMPDEEREKASGAYLEPDGDGAA